METEMKEAKAKLEFVHNVIGSQLSIINNASKQIKAITDKFEEEQRKNNNLNVFGYKEIMYLILILIN